MIKLTHTLLSLCLASIMASTTAWADKPEWAGKGKNGREDHQGADRRERRDDDRHRDETQYRFDADSRRIISSYYGEAARGGHCPPGLAKKRNGCLPPGQAKKWSRGQRLPADLRYHPLPDDLLRRLPPPPSRHRYVQVAEDILLIAEGSSMVIDAVEDILR
jgi:Ni/Co efflux regulator RcnB